jgi:tripeptidyl-peptidase-1
MVIDIPPNTYYNVTGRGVPDLCSFSEGVEIMINGFGFEVGGTSCAAPVVSGIISLLNDARLLQGKSTLGFLNPWLYSLPADAFIGKV